MQEQITQLTPRQIYSRAYYKANKETMREKMRAWNADNKEKIRAWCEANKERKAEINRAWHLANPAYSAEYREVNKESIKEQMRAWHKANPEYGRNAYAKRRADTIGEITPGWIPKLLELQRWTCIVCNKDLRYGYHIDHIYPVSKGGENTDYNLQALCPKCNHEKSNKDPIDFMRSRGFLL